MKQFSITIPKQDNEGKKQDIALGCVRNIVTQLSKKFGGCSVIEGSGYYVMPDGSLVKDDWFKVSTICNPTDLDRGYITGLAEVVKTSLVQDSVLVEESDVVPTFI